LKEREGVRSKRGKGRRVQGEVWDEKGRERFKVELGSVVLSEREVQEEVEEMEGRIKEVIERLKTERMEDKGWKKDKELME